MSPRDATPRDPWAGILSGPVDGPARLRATYPEVTASPGLAVRHRSSGFTGVVVRFEGDGVVVRGGTGLERVLRSAPGAFDVEGRAVTLVRAKAPPAPAPAVTSSGSIAVNGQRARVARASRILVEGVHDAELVERVWGDDLRVEGVVVERLDGLDHLASVVAEFGPGPGNRLGVLVDHLVPGSKEARLAAEVDHPHVLVTGHPFVDVWEAVKPAVVGIPAWPVVPKGVDWKTGVCRRLGVADPTRHVAPQSSRPSAPTPTSSRPSSAPSNASSTSSPSRPDVSHDGVMHACSRSQRTTTPNGPRRRDPRPILSTCRTVVVRSSWRPTSSRTWAFGHWWRPDGMPPIWPGSWPTPTSAASRSAPSSIGPVTRSNGRLRGFFGAGERNETLLLYFSGHGLKDESGMLYFAMADTEVDLLSASAVSASFVSGQLGRARARTKIVLLDCCYSGAFSRSLMTKDDRLVNVAEELRGIGRVVITASNSLQYSFEGRTPSGDAHQSVFTKHLVAGLETGAADLDGDGRIAVDELYRYVYDQVVQENPQQQPSISSETQGMVVLASSRVGVRPARLPDELLWALSNTLPRVRLGAVEELADLLQGTDLRTAAAARAALEELLDDDSRRVTEAAATALAMHTMSGTVDRLGGAGRVARGRVASGRRRRRSCPAAVGGRATRAGRRQRRTGARSRNGAARSGPVPAASWSGTGAYERECARACPTEPPDRLPRPGNRRAGRDPAGRQPRGNSLARVDCLPGALGPAAQDGFAAAAPIDPDLAGLLLRPRSVREEEFPGIASADCGVSHTGVLAAAFAGVAVILAGVAVTGRTRMTETQSAWTRGAMLGSLALAALALLNRLSGPGNDGADGLPGNDLAVGLMVVTVVGALLVMRRPDRGVAGATTGP